MIKQINAGVWAGLLLLVFSVVVLFQSFQYSYTSEIGPGPGFFPVWLSGILLVLSLLYIYESARGRQFDGDPKETKKSNYNILFILFNMFIFVILVSLLGFVLSGSIFLFCLLYKSYKWYSSTAISIGLSLFFFWLFDIVLGVSLPVNGFGF